MVNSHSQLLASHGEMGTLIQDYDWRSTSLGALDEWPQSLKTTTGLLLQSPVPIVLLWGEDGTMIYNDAYSVFAGQRHPGVLGKKVREGWPEVADFNDHIMKVCMGGGTLIYKNQELTLHRPGLPDQVWLDLYYSPVLDESGKPGGVIVLVVETTEQVQAEKRRDAERDQLWTLSQDMLARANYSGSMTAVNPAWTQVLGWSEHELLTNPYSNIIHPNDVDITVAALARMRLSNEPTRFENRILAANGEWKPIGWTVSPEPDAINFIAVGRDLADYKARERELLEAQEALRQSQKMEAVGQLTGGIAHDFNNLLAAISGSLELLEMRLADNRTGAQRYISAAQDATARATALTQRLLAFSRRQTLDPKPIDLNKLVAGMEELIRRTMGPTIDVQVIGTKGLWPTRADLSQVENSLLNLCINARDAMAPHNGRLTIETANKWLDERAARERELPPGQYVSLYVTDTGTGMSPEVSTRAFDPFFTTKPIGHGTGLGLSMVYGFARQSGGQVRIHSQLGKGTTLCLYLPRHKGSVDSIESITDTPSTHSGNGEIVLVIDDEVLVRMLIVDVLQDNGCQVLEAADGPSGLKILQSETPIDLLITDVGLPGGLNGRQIADAARRTRPGLKVLFITGYAANAVIGDGQLEAGMDVITKPFVITALKDKILEMIANP